MNKKFTQVLKKTPQEKFFIAKKVAKKKTFHQHREIN